MKSLFNRQLKAIHKFNELMHDYTKDMKPEFVEVIQEPDFPIYDPILIRNPIYVKYWEGSYNGDEIRFEFGAVDDTDWYENATWNCVEDFFDCCGMF